MHNMGTPHPLPTVNHWFTLLWLFIKPSMEKVKLST